MITCKTCGNDKPQSEFYASNKTQCKACVRDRVKRYRADNRSKVLEYDRNRPNAHERNARFKVGHAERMRDHEYKDRVSQTKRLWAARNRDKRAAHFAVSNAIRSGLLARRICEQCGEPSAEAHHDDYGKPLEVRWLCVKHHAEHHKTERARIRLGRRS